MDYKPNTDHSYSNTSPGWTQRTAPPHPPSIPNLGLDHYLVLFDFKIVLILRDRSD